MSIFPLLPLRVYRYLKLAILKRRVAVGAPIYLSAVLEYLCAEVLELAGNAARDNKKKIITPRHILLAVANDDELHRVCSKYVVNAQIFTTFQHTGSWFWRQIVFELSLSFCVPSCCEV